MFLVRIFCCFFFLIYFKIIAPEHSGMQQFHFHCCPVNCFRFPLLSLSRREFVRISSHFPHCSGSRGNGTLGIQWQMLRYVSISTASTPSWASQRAREREVCSETQSRVSFCSQLCCPFKAQALGYISILFPKTKDVHLAARLPCCNQQWDYRSERPYPDQMETNELRTTIMTWYSDAAFPWKDTKSFTIFTSHSALACSLPESQQPQSSELEECLHLFPSSLLSFHAVSSHSSVYFMYFWHFKVAHWQLP